MSNAVSKPVFQFLNQCFTYNPTFRNLPLTGLEEEVLLVRIGFEEYGLEHRRFVPFIIHIYVYVYRGCISSSCAEILNEEGRKGSS